MKDIQFRRLLNDGQHHFLSVVSDGETSQVYSGGGMIPKNPVTMTEWDRVLSPGEIEAVYREELQEKPQCL